MATERAERIAIPAAKVSRAAIALRGIATKVKRLLNRTVCNKVPCNKPSRKHPRKKRLSENSSSDSLPDHFPHQSRHETHVVVHRRGAEPRVAERARRRCPVSLLGAVCHGSAASD